MIPTTNFARMLNKPLDAIHRAIYRNYDLKCDTKEHTVARSIQLGITLYFNNHGTKNISYMDISDDMAHDLLLHFCPIRDEDVIDYLLNHLHSYDSGDRVQLTSRDTIN